MVAGFPEMIISTGLYHPSSRVPSKQSLAMLLATRPFPANVIYINVYIYREREREIDRYMYIYIYTRREREIDR